MQHTPARSFTPFLVVTTLLLAACGGGGGGGGGAALPSAPAVTSAQGGAASSATVAITLDLPSGSSSSARRSGSGTRSPQFVDNSNATQLLVTVSSINGVGNHQSSSYALGSGKPVTCTGGVCTLTTSLPTGQDVIQFTIEDANNRPLGQSEVTATVVQGTNSITTTINGIVAALSSPSCTTASTTFQSDGEHIPLVVSATDIDNGTIGTPGLFAATASTDSAALLDPLTISSTNSQTKFSVNGVAATNPATINAPGDVISLVYSGPTVSGVTIPLTLGASVTNSIPGAAAIVQTTGTCQPQTNVSVVTGPSTVLDSQSVTDSGAWILQSGSSSGQQPNAGNTDCFAPPATTFIGINDAQCSYSVSGSWTKFTATTTPGVNYNLQYTGTVLLDYWNTALSPANFQTSAVVTGTYLFVDTNNPKNTFTATLTGSTSPASAFAPTSAAATFATGTLAASGSPASPGTTVATVTLTPPSGSAVVVSYTTISADSALSTFLGDLAYAINHSAAGTGGSAFVTATAGATSITITSLYAGSNGNATTFLAATTGVTYTPATTTALSTGSNSQVNASLVTAPSSGTKLSWTISGTGGVFAGVSGTLSENFTSTASGFANVKDTNFPQQLDYPHGGVTIPVTGTLSGI